MQVLHFWWEYCHSDPVFSVLCGRRHRMSVCPVPGDYLVRRRSAWFLHCELTLFLFAVMYLVQRDFGTM